MDARSRSPVAKAVGQSDLTSANLSANPLSRAPMRPLAFHRFREAASVQRPTEQGHAHSAPQFSPSLSYLHHCLACRKAAFKNLDSHSHAWGQLRPAAAIQTYVSRMARFAWFVIASVSRISSIKLSEFVPDRSGPPVIPMRVLSWGHRLRDGA